MLDANSGAGGVGLEGGPQRVIVKVSFAPHRAGSGKLATHAAYLGRDGAARDGEQGRFYSAGEDRVEELGQELGTWSREDPRHFRIVIAPESAARLDDLDAYVREVMARMERDLGTATDWVAVNHWNTDNPHAHVILRGRSQDGRELRIPRAYLSHGLRHQAREIATGLLGERGEQDDRLALDRAVRSRGLTSLDRTIAASLEGRGEVLVQDLGAGENSLWTDALRGRARELAARGLALEVRRNVLAFRPGWQEALAAAGPLDIAKAHGRELAREAERVADGGDRETGHPADHDRVTGAHQASSGLTGEIVGIEIGQSVGLGVGRGVGMGMGQSGSELSLHVVSALGLGSDLSRYDRGLVLAGHQAPRGDVPWRNERDLQIAASSGCSSFRHLCLFADSLLRPWRQRELRDHDHLLRAGFPTSLPRSCDRQLPQRPSRYPRAS